MSEQPVESHRNILNEENIQNQLDIILSILEDNQHKLSDGEYLRGMNALGLLHRHKKTVSIRNRAMGALEGWLTYNDIYNDEQLYDEVLELADRIVVEICGENSSIYLDDTYNIVSRGQEEIVFERIVNYAPEEGNAGYESSPFLLHHALQIIMIRLFNDTYHELQIVRPVSCKCGWRGTQGNWDRHIGNKRHQRWCANNQ